MSNLDDAIITLKIKKGEHASINKIFNRHITNLHKILMPDLVRKGLLKDIRIVKSILDKSGKTGV